MNGGAATASRDTVSDFPELMKQWPAGMMTTTTTVDPARCIPVQRPHVRHMGHIFGAIFTSF